MAQARARLAACGAGDWAEALLVLEVVGVGVEFGCRLTVGPRFH